MEKGSAKIRELANSISEINRRLTAYEMTPQLGNTSIENKGLNVYVDGEKTGVIGVLPDGSSGVQVISGPVPAAPSGITAETGLGSIVVSWPGTFVGDVAAPGDLSLVAIHASPTPGFVPSADNTITTISYAEPSSRVIPLAAGTYYVSATSLSLAGKRSEATPEVQAEAGPLVDDQGIKDALDAERTAREDAAEAAQAELAELDGKLAELNGTPEAIESIRSALTTAQEAVSGAQTMASEAVTAANAASQAALEAAGIAASKGRVIVQESEPVGEDRKASNIWIQPVPDDPETEVEEKAVTYVYLEASDEWTPTTSSELAQAAQNALDAREAAQQAQQRADTAIANAASAQAAAEEAQRTADVATTDAREAHNAAVEAQEVADALFASGENMAIYGGFEAGIDAIFPSLTASSRAGLETVTDGSQAREGSRYLRYTSDGETNVFGYMTDINVEAYHTYRVSFYARKAPGSEDVSLNASLGWPMNWIDSPGDVTYNGNWPALFYPDEVSSKLTGEWAKFEADVMAGEKATRLRPRFYATGGSIPAGTQIDIDNLVIRDITEAVYAQANAQAAQDRAEEAYGLADSKATPAEVAAAATAAENAARTAAAADAKAKADKAKADALAGAATDAASKAAAAQAAAVAAASADAKTKADKALSDALAALSNARGEITTEIKASANGKNAITISTSSPSGSGVVNGDVWWRIDTSGVIYGQWIWSGSAWTARTIRSEVIANLDVHKLTVTGTAMIKEAVIDKIWADGISARVVTASKLIVSTGNIIPDGMEMATESQWAPLTRSTVNKPAGVPASRTTQAGQGAIGIANAPFPVTPGQVYSVEMWVKADKPNSRMYLEIRNTVDNAHAGTGKLFEPEQVNTTAYALLNNRVIETEWTKYRGEWTANAGVSEVKFGTFYFNHSNGSERNASISIAGLSMRPKVGAVLIEDGSISADKLAADSVTAGKIAANAVEAGHVAANAIDADAIQANAVTAHQIDATSVATELITTSSLRTNATGERLELNSEGVVLYGEDPDSGEFEQVRLGPSGANLLTVGESTISPDAVSALRGEFETLIAGGQDLTALLADSPKGVVAFAYEGVNSAWDGTFNDIIRLQCDVELLPNRRYSITVDQHYTQLRTPIQTSYVEAIRWKDNGTVLTIGTSSEIATSRHILQATTDPQTVPPITAWVDTHEDQFGTSAKTCFFGLAVRGSGQTDVRLVARNPDYPVRLTIRDEGPTLAATGKSWFHIGTPDGTGAEAPPEKVEVKRTTSTWSAAGYGGDLSSGDVVQGYYPGAGNRSGSWKFPSAMRSALTGATVEKLQVYLYADHWYYGSGGTASVRATNGSSYQSWTGTPVTSTKWPRNAGRWITLPSAWYPAIVNGSCTGIGVQADNDSRLYYGRFSAGATKFRATYRR